MQLDNNTSSIISSKNSLIENVQKWVLIDTQLKIINEKTKKLRDMKHDTTKSICEYMKSQPSNQIGITDGELRIYEKKEYSQLTFSYIESKLSEIIPEKENVEYIVRYLKEKREITNVKDIRRIDRKKIET